MSFWSPDAWLQAWRFAAAAHQGQQVPDSDLPYLVHIGAVAMEVSHALAQRERLGQAVARPDLAIQVALLHDVVEDTEVTVWALAREFSQVVATGVAALSKNASVGDKQAQMRDSLERIRRQPEEVWMVKLADRITNLQPPPASWSKQKILRYREESKEIHAALGEACPILAARLAEKIEHYQVFA
ncbi:bifunctional (p)ppGpp synthetase/guanosine-3',5'-bis(diphosphate) 3'-pyrophosphohydrolase [Pseudenhygromyxa sp. WMMC2535]|uniref:HD domain-containing protein n=1 Tax=Pseudenhygromyxa sp. WMMC2535 TaxID=2712867 RepID=UPI001551E390|nr:HD domain-containing protein [Pseudenhygromyxa sp. WMMC2535]NVB38151.1 bifunctional (p)ppGpp synthetase/guanosine-3',5'-bis(diphosphate) 3'-pyrophosphohydrolase [Pseudenhygromyxa sp. WMMC2535]